ncbi:proline-rich protein 2-like [Neopsephotus bourkii]|uniref:proline-rich protein 2-like n=1 Tax=Neopsephotus bourkii TaxID=309878 RepID=UPI002AA516D0|nr:proline-rich protein 2-like [Neopsephotus bourkii]
MELSEINCPPPPPAQARARSTALSRCPGAPGGADHHRGLRAPRTRGRRIAPVRPIRPPQPPPQQQQRGSRSTREGHERPAPDAFSTPSDVPRRASRSAPVPPATPAFRNSPDPAEPCGAKASVPEACDCGGRPPLGPEPPVRRHQQGHRGAEPSRGSRGRGKRWQGSEARVHPLPTSRSLHHRVDPSAGSRSRHLPPSRHFNSRAPSRLLPPPPRTWYTLSRAACWEMWSPATAAGTAGARWDCEERPLGEPTGKRHRGGQPQPGDAAHRRPLTGLRGPQLLTGRKEV